MGELPPVPIKIEPKPPPKVIPKAARAVPTEAAGAAGTKPGEKPTTAKPGEQSKKVEKPDQQIQLSGTKADGTKVDGTTIYVVNNSEKHVMGGKAITEFHVLGKGSVGPQGIESAQLFSHAPGNPDVLTQTPGPGENVNWNTVRKVGFIDETGNKVEIPVEDLSLVNPAGPQEAPAKPNGGQRGEQPAAAQGEQSKKVEKPDQQIQLGGTKADGTKVDGTTIYVVRNQDKYVVGSDKKPVTEFHILGRESVKPSGVESGQLFSHGPGDQDVRTQTPGVGENVNWNTVGKVGFIDANGNQVEIPVEDLSLVNPAGPQEAPAQPSEKPADADHATATAPAGETPAATEENPNPAASPEPAAEDAQSKEEIAKENEALEEVAELLLQRKDPRIGPVLVARAAGENTPTTPLGRRLRKQLRQEVIRELQKDEKLANEPGAAKIRAITVPEKSDVTAFDEFLTQHAKELGPEGARLQAHLIAGDITIVQASDLMRSYAPVAEAYLTELLGEKHPPMNTPADMLQAGHMDASKQNIKRFEKTYETKTPVKNMLRQKLPGIASTSFVIFLTLAVMATNQSSQQGH